MPEDFEQVSVRYLDEEERAALNKVALEVQDPLSKIIPIKNQHPLTGVEQFEKSETTQQPTPVVKEQADLPDVLETAIHYTQGEKAPRTAPAGEFAKMRVEQAAKRGQVVKEDKK